LAEWFKAAMKVPEVNARMKVLGLYPVDASVADFVALLHRRSGGDGRIIKEAGGQGGEGSRHPQGGGVAAARRGAARVVPRARVARRGGRSSFEARCARTSG